MQTGENRVREYENATAEVRFALALAEARGMTQKQLSDVTKIKQPMLSRYERGQIPAVPTLQKIAAALNAQITIKSDGTPAVELVTK